MTQNCFPHLVVSQVVDQSAWWTLIVSMVTSVRIRGALRSQTRVIQVLVDQEQPARPTLLVIQSVGA